MPHELEYERIRGLTAGAALQLWCHQFGVPYDAERRQDLPGWASLVPPEAIVSISLGRTELYFDITGGFVGMLLDESTEWVPAISPSLIPGWCGMEGAPDAS